MNAVTGEVLNVIIPKRYSVGTGERDTSLDCAVFDDDVIPGYKNTSTVDIAITKDEIVAAEDIVANTTRSRKVHILEGLTRASV